MKDCRSTEELREYGVHLVAQLCDMLEIDGYELGIRDRRRGKSFYWSSWELQKGEGDDED